MDLSFDKDDKLLKKYNNVCNKFSNSINQKFDNKHIYSKNFLKTKIKSYGDESADSHDKKQGSDYTCLAVIYLDFVLRKDEDQCSQVNVDALKKKERWLDILLKTYRFLMMIQMIL